MYAVASYITLQEILLIKTESLVKTGYYKNETAYGNYLYSLGVQPVGHCGPHVRPARAYASRTSTWSATLKVFRASMYKICSQEWIKMAEKQCVNRAKREKILSIAMPETDRKGSFDPNLIAQNLCSLHQNLRGPHTGALRAARRRRLDT